MFKLCSNHDQLLLFGFFVAVVSCGAHLRFKEATTGLRRLRTIRGPWGPGVRAQWLGQAWTTGITKGLDISRNTSPLSHEVTKCPWSFKAASPCFGGDPTHDLHQGCRPQWHESNQLQRCGPQAVQGHPEPSELWSWFRQSGCDEQTEPRSSVYLLSSPWISKHTLCRCQGGMNVKQQVLWLLVYHRFAPPQPYFSHSTGDANSNWSIFGDVHVRGFCGNL